MFKRTVDRARAAASIRNGVKTLAAARTPIIVAIIYCVFLMLPNQTAEAIRSTFEAGTWSLIGVLVGWYLLTSFFMMVLVGATSLALRRLRTERGAEKFDSFQVTVIRIVTVAPLLALTVAAFNTLNLSFPVERGWIEALKVLGLQLWHDGAALYFLFSVLTIGFIMLRMDYDRSDDEIAAVALGAALVALVLIVLRIISAVFGVTADPPPVLSFTGWMTIVLAILMGIEALSRRWAFPLLSTAIIAALVWAAFDWSDNHVVPTVEAGAGKPRPVGEAFADWLEQRAPEIRKYRDAGRFYPVFLVAAEGGGSRAAYMTALVLETLRTRCPDAIRHTFLVAGVSGGSVGATWRMPARPGRESAPVRARACRPSVRGATLRPSIPTPRRPTPQASISCARSCAGSCSAISRCASCPPASGPRSSPLGPIRRSTWRPASTGPGGTTTRASRAASTGWPRRPSPACMAVPGRMRRRWCCSRPTSAQAGVSPSAI
jgi:hypothetical protein